MLLLGLAIMLFLRPDRCVAGSRSVLDLQPCQTTSTLTFGTQKATLYNLNPYINAWYVFELKQPNGVEKSYHLENSFPDHQSLELDRNDGLVLVGDSATERCVLWKTAADTTLSSATGGNRPFVELCNGKVFLRNQSAGHRTRKEWVADLLRDRVRYGESITNFIKERFFKDKYRLATKVQQQDTPDKGSEEARSPIRVSCIDGARNMTLSAPELNLMVSGEPSGGFIPGRWYAVPGYDGIYLSVVTPGLVALDSSWVKSNTIDPLDSIEASSIVYLVAFDLSVFDLRYAVGTDHPRVDWSDRVPASSRDTTMPGPDGFGTIYPLQRTGKVNPREVGEVAAAFASGFKRTHGAFKWGDLSRVNHGSHYGFMEEGVILSTLQPGLATLVVYMDGTVEMKTWDESDQPTVQYIRYARQNGVPLLEVDNETCDTVPGKLVRDWAGANWSGSESKLLRTLRAGACIQETERTSFLIYGYLSSATPSAMARVFDACHTDYAMHLDMNAPEHTYLAIYRAVGSQFIVQRLVKEMAEVDPSVGGQELPRFIGYSDNRDFFYLLRKDQGEKSQ